MSGEKSIQFRLFQEESPEPTREDEQARNPEEKLGSRGRPEDKIRRSESKKAIKKEIELTKRKLKERTRKRDEDHLKFILRQRREGK
jgi:hypothetical protein